MDVLQGESGISVAKAQLSAGGCVALPTETVYGLAADASNSEAVRRIFTAKGRPENHPLIIHIPSAEHLQRWADPITDDVQRLASAFWPGPLTLILPKRPDINTPASAGLPTLGLRVPEHPLFLRILRELDIGLAAPSANRYKGLSPTCAEQVVDQLDGRIEAVLDGGSCSRGIESTIVDMSSQPYRVLRAGPITAAQLEAILGKPVLVPERHSEVVPGNVQAHYQPRTPVFLDSAESLATLADEKIEETGFIVYSDALRKILTKRSVTNLIELDAEPASYAREIYYALFSLDRAGLSSIRVEQPPTTPAWLAINDRLGRSASPDHT
ncbi:MAG TPA: L-threonylcarbamoyladenylate synthase [Marinobacterium sp.]|nr:L-threonylcarbamoyladenylate synthase [Marinobacterium sp.]